MKLIASLPSGPSSAAADRGTGLHHFAGLVIAGAAPESLVGKQHSNYTLNSIDARTALLPAVAAYGRFVGRAKNVTLERKVRIAQHVWGTADILGHHKGVGLVGDFKFGSGVVEAKSNEQMLFYAAGALIGKQLPPSTSALRLAIIQPANRKVLDEWEVDAKRVREFGAEVKRVAKIALGDDPAGLNPGEKQCTWCPAEPVCPARKQQRATAQPDLAKSLLTLSR